MDNSRFVKQQFSNLAQLGNVTTPYGGKTAWESFHPGIDIANKKGTTIPSPVNGVVEKVVAGKQNGDAGYGNSVTVKDANGDRHQLGHLDKPLARPGQSVQAGRPVGTMGNTGSAYSLSGKGDGTHLDYRIVSAYGKYKNPMLYLRNFQ